MTLRAAGQSQEEIAGFMRCDPKTLRKYFSRELDSGAALLEGLAMQVLVKRMLDGNVSAAKQVKEICSLRIPKADKQKAAVVPGKKESLRQQSERPMGSWATVLDVKPH